jgi:hypothetical protein
VKVGGKQQEVLVRRSGDATPRVIWRTDIVGRMDRGIGNMSVMPSGSVIFQRDTLVGIVDTNGTWRTLLAPTAIATPKDESFRLTDVTPLGSTGDAALLSVSFSKYNVYSMGTSGIATSTTWSAWPKLFHFDGSTVTEVKDSAAAFTSLYTSMSPQPIARRIAGYDGLVLAHPLASGPKIPAKYFDPSLGGIVPAPAFRTNQGDISLDQLIGWNSESEAVVRPRTGGFYGLAVLRRR